LLPNIIELSRWRSMKEVGHLVVMRSWELRLRNSHVPV
jgi:hypothetical protein